MPRELPAQAMAPPPPARRAELLYQIGEQLRPIRAILEMLEAGGWVASAGAHLATRLGSARLTAGELGWLELEAALADLQREIAGCVRRNCAPDPRATVLHHIALAAALVPGPTLRRDVGRIVAPLTA
jgi:hypothetical protein